MATPRRLLVDPVNECDYHLVSRCVRGAFLCGVDKATGRDCAHRREWLISRMRQLAPCFAIDVYAYTVLSNHFHLVVRHDPQAWRDWSDGDVARRWCDAFPPTERGEVVAERKAERRELLLADADRLDRARRTLGSMSHFMKHLKQPIARRANVEDDCTGHFFEQRFYSGALLTEEALLAAMAYVDLNPVRAGLAARIEDIRDTSIGERLQVNDADALASYLAPVLSGLDPRPDGDGGPASEPDDEADGHPGDLPAEGPAPAPEAEPGTEAGTGPNASPDPAPGAAKRPERRPRRPRPGIALAVYIALIRAMIAAETAPDADPPDKARQWLARTKILRKRQRAFGTAQALRDWIDDRGMRLRETPLPA